MQNMLGNSILENASRKETVKEKLCFISTLLLAFILLFQISSFFKEDKKDNVPNNTKNSEIPSENKMVEEQEQSFETFMSTHHKEQLDLWKSENKYLIPSFKPKHIDINYNEATVPYSEEETLWLFSLTQEVKELDGESSDDIPETIYIATKDYLLDIGNASPETCSQYYSLDENMIVTYNGGMDSNKAFFVFNSPWACISETRMYRFKTGEQIPFEDTQKILDTNAFDNALLENGSLNDVFVSEITSISKIENGEKVETGWVVEGDYGYVINIGKIFFDENGQLLSQISL